MRRLGLPRLPRAARKMALGLVALLVLTFSGSAYGLLTAPGRVDPALAPAQGSVNVLVVLDFKPESFHMRQLQSHGTVGAVTARGVELRRVTPAHLEALTRTPWIGAIQPLAEAR